MYKARIAGKSQAGFDKLGRQVQRLLEEVSDKTVDVARANTPKRTGYARKNWTKDVSKDTFEVSNATPYIQFLDKGISKQAPSGIVKPTVRKMTGFIGTRRLKR